jgi:hypothetical protein
MKSYDGLIWIPPMRDGFIADPVTMAEILWSIQPHWYIVSVHDPEDREDFCPAMEYFVDIGLFEEPVSPRVESILKLTINNPLSNYVLVKPNDLQSLIFMIAYSDFDGLQIRSIDEHVNRYYDALKLWINSEEILHDEATEWSVPSRLPSIKHVAKISILWGLPNWDCLRNALVISGDEKALYHMKNVIEKYKQDHNQNDDEEYDHQVILCDAREEILKWPKGGPRRY